MPRSRAIQLFGVGACVALILAASTRIPAINEGRRALNLMATADVTRQAPPEYAFFIQAFGAFRSLIVNFAFIRLETLKEKGRYFDAMQLARWICTLQPYFPAVWEYASWNMAWNISVTTFTAEERWNWVYNGVKLLRDLGIRYNPRAVNLYKQLAWTFNNKMSEPTDDYHLAYKANWAWRMHLVLGEPPRPQTELDPNAVASLADAEQREGLLTAAARVAWEQNEEKRRRMAQERGQRYVERRFEDVHKTAVAEGEGLTPYKLARKAAADAIREIATAPRTLEALYREQPPAREMVAALRGLGLKITDDELSEEEYWAENGLARNFFMPYRRLASPDAILMSLLQTASERDDPVASAAQKLDDILGVRAGNPAGQALVRWLQRKVLEQVYRLELDHMIAVIEEFGPVDWRSVDSQSLYWVTRGLIAGGESPNDFRSDKLNTARIMFFSLRNLFLRNRIVFDPAPERIQYSYLNFSRDLNFIEPMHQAFLRYGPLFDPKEGSPGAAGDAFRIGHFNFISEAIRSLYLSGREAEAEHYFRWLQANYPLTDTGQVNQAVRKSLRDFVLDNFLDTTASTPGPREVRVAVEALLDYAISELAAGNAQGFAAATDRAREIYDRYQSDQSMWMQASKRLPPFIDIQIDVVGQVLAAPPISHVVTLKKVRLWRALPLFLRQPVYDVLLDVFRFECEQFGFDVARAFPEPPGMDAYRAAHPTRRRSDSEPQPRPGQPDEVETLPPKFSGQ